MILDLILGAFYALLSGIVNLLPTGTFPIPDNTGQAFGEWIYKLDYVLPFVAPLAWLVTAVTASMAALIAYRGGIFLFNKVRGS